MAGQKIAGYSATEWRVAGVIGLVGLAGAVYFFSSGESAQAREQRLQKREAETQVSVARGSALLNCQRALKNAALDPEKATIPAVPPLKGGADWRFLWGPQTEQVRMRNGLGLEVAVGAFCVVDEDSGRIKLLTLDGKQLIAPGTS